MFDEGVTLTITTRGQAIADGDLVDVTSLAIPIGFTVPTAVTNGIWETVLGSPSDDAVTKAFLAFVIAQARKEGPTGEPIMKFQFKGFRLWLHAGPGDRDEMVMTIMFPEEY